MKGIQYDSSRPCSELLVDIAWQLEVERRATFSTGELPECMRVGVFIHGRLVPRLLPAPKLKHVVMMRPAGGALECAVLGISEADAKARVERLNLRHRPDGFHLWS